MKVIIHTDPNQKRHANFSEIEERRWFSFRPDQCSNYHQIYIKVGGHIYHFINDGLSPSHGQASTFENLRYITIQEIISYFIK